MFNSSNKVAKIRFKIPAHSCQIKVLTLIMAAKKNASSLGIANKRIKRINYIYLKISPFTKFRYFNKITFFIK